MTMEVLKLLENPGILRLLAKELSFAKIAPHQQRSLEVSFRHMEIHLSEPAFNRLKNATVELLHALNAIEDRGYAEVTTTTAYAPSLSSCPKCSDCHHYDACSATCWLPERMEEHTPRRPDFPACAGFMSAKKIAQEVLKEIEIGEDDEF